MQIPSYQMIQVVKNKTQNIVDPTLTSQMYGYTVVWVTIEGKETKLEFPNFRLFCVKIMVWQASLISSLFWHTQKMTGNIINGVNL